MTATNRPASCLADIIACALPKAQWTFEKIKQYAGSVKPCCLLQKRKKPCRKSACLEHIVLAEKTLLQIHETTSTRPYTQHNAVGWDERSSVAMHRLPTGPNVPAVPLSRSHPVTLSLSCSRLKHAQNPCRPLTSAIPPSYSHKRHRPEHTHSAMQSGERSASSCNV